ncbi:uncharacterized protein F5891DRAFT_980041 [Suillus fuscotomentosus]|uniref:Uncharacterized protein n=1 Tax=Suillus fuscotomentosus TaxID=1912939 RepID=A0AAD4E7K2_9AGAM|nr:uncharacterized protein F5891DRAFT_980041 [Suillus fuscotomentosus]KAG1900827.1 hypothetical protein F5891DRAFT_980041 [Suillus fuscotomentosus]
MVDMLVRGQLYLVITNITNHLYNMLPIILKVTEDDALSYKLPAIFYEVPDMVDMLVRGQLKPVITNITNYLNQLLSIIFKITEDDAPSYKLLRIFYEVSDLNTTGHIQLFVKNARCFNWVTPS